MHGTERAGRPHPVNIRTQPQPNTTSTSDVMEAGPGRDRDVCSIVNRGQSSSGCGSS